MATNKHKKHRTERDDHFAEEINTNEAAASGAAEDSIEPENGKEATGATEEVTQELAQMKEKYLRLVAEFDNYRKRTSRERMELFKTAGEEVIKPLLEVLDDADRAEEQMEKTTELSSLKSGVALIFNKLRKVLGQQGLEPMQSVGQEFDPESHDAVTEIPAPEEKKGKVMDEVQKGYLLNDKIIRHAKVVVGK